MTQGFEVIELIVDVKNCLQAYVGYASDMNAVVVVFRGTQETRYIAYHFMISVYFFSKY
jgi:hypothetical protein